MFLLWYKFTKINGNVSDIIIFPEAGYITERSNLQIYRHIINLQKCCFKKQCVYIQIVLNIK